MQRPGCGPTQQVLEEILGYDADRIANLVIADALRWAARFAFARRRCSTDCQTSPKGNRAVRVAQHSSPDPMQAESHRVEHYRAPLKV